MFWQRYESGGRSDFVLPSLLFLKKFGETLPDNGNNDDNERFFLNQNRDFLNQNRDFLNQNSSSFEEKMILAQEILG